MTLADLYDTYEATLLRYANSLTHDPDQADDLVQETFIRCLGHLPLLEMLSASQRRAWLKRTLKNLFIDGERARQRQERLLQQLEVNEVLSEQNALAPVLAPDPFESVAEDDQELFHMRYVLGMNSTEIGEEMGLPPATVRSRLHYAMKKLRMVREKWRE